MDEVDMRKMAMGIVAAGLALSGCGWFSATPCEKADEAVRAVAEASKGCSGVSVPTLPGRSACEDALESCNAAEKLVIDEEMDCLTGVDACVSGKESDWLKSVATCLVPVAALSDSCKKGFVE